MVLDEAATLDWQLLAVLPFSNNTKTQRRVDFAT
jgi:hypothetical protein